MNESAKTAPPAPSAPSPAPEPTVPAPEPTMLSPRLPQAPSAKQQSWGTVISIVIIVLMVVIGAFYSWGKRIAQEQSYGVATGTQP